MSSVQSSLLFLYCVVFSAVCVSVGFSVHSVQCQSAQFYWAIQRSWFARVNALCNLSRKKSREVAAHFRADF